MQFTLDNLPDMEFTGTYDPETQRLTLVGVRDGGEIMRCGFFCGTPELAPKTEYVQLDAG